MTTRAAICMRRWAETALVAVALTGLFLAGGLCAPGSHVAAQAPDPEDAAPVATPDNTSPAVSPDEPDIAFGYVDVFVDSGDTPLAAWQLELVDRTERVRIVGVEGGEHPAFQAAPYYDPNALTRNRIIIAAFSTERELPSGRARVARLHLASTGPLAVEFASELSVAAAADGAAIDGAKLELVTGE